MHKKKLFSLSSKAKFYLSLPFNNILSVFESYNFRFQLLAAEFIFFLPRFLKPFNFFPESQRHAIFKTRFGDFYMRKTVIDFYICSPSFERPDLNELIKLIDKCLKKKEKVTFIDIGAGIGKYTVSIGNYFANFGNKLLILSFEPEKTNFNLLKQNVVLNKLSHVRTFNKALSDRVENRKFFIERSFHMLTDFGLFTKEKVLVKTEILDNYIKYIPKDCRHIFLKIDTEGHEPFILRGASKIFKRHSRVTLMIEDTVSKELLEYLGCNFIFIKKVTPYNSFWQAVPR